MKQKHIKVPVLYALDQNARKWDLWHIELTPKEQIVYRLSVFFKINLHNVSQLEPVLYRAHDEIQSAYTRSERIRVEFLEPNYGNNPPDAPFLYVHRAEVTRLLRALDNFSFDE